MGVISGLMSNASKVDVAAIEKEYQVLMGSGEKIEHAYKLLRDMFIFTNRRLILVDKQGITGKKTEYMSVPYGSVTRFSVETAGTFDMDAELKIWLSGNPLPIQKQFNKAVNIYEVQAILTEYVCCK